MHIVPLEIEVFLPVKGDFKGIVGSQYLQIVAPCQKSRRLTFLEKSRRLGFLRDKVELPQGTWLRIIVCYAYN